MYNGQYQKYKNQYRNQLLHIHTPSRGRDFTANRAIVRTLASMQLFLQKKIAQKKPLLG